MLNKNDCMSLLVKLEDKGLDINPYMRKLVMSKEVPLEVLKFISDNRGIEVGNFYEIIRRNHNKNKSPLYTNIVKEDTYLNENEIAITLSALLTQIALHGKKTEEATVRDKFYKEARANEITTALATYFETGDITLAKTLLTLVRADLMVLEYIAGRRELAGQ